MNDDKENTINKARLLKGFGWGVVATIAMSVLMVIATLTGKSPMPKPIPIAIIASILGAETPKPALMILGMLSHLAYGGFFGAALAAVTGRVTVWKGVGLGLVLWLVMQLVVLPFLGWGVFGSAVTPMIAVATLVLHLIYGATFGLLCDRGSRSAPTAS